ncbi:MAG: hypothetical protein IPN72_14670 [Saprospiraceae bacterium]|nr:hypothetical protein [Saprospiraceae bacterium]
MKNVSILLVILIFYTVPNLVFAQKSIRTDEHRAEFIKRTVAKHPAKVSEKELLAMVSKYDMVDEFFESNGKVREDCRHLLIMDKKNLSNYVTQYYEEDYGFRVQFKALKEEMTTYTSIAEFFRKLECNYPKVDEHFKEGPDYNYWKNGMLEQDNQMFLGVEKKTGAIMFLHDDEYDRYSKDPGYIVFYKPKSLEKK